MPEPPSRVRALPDLLPARDASALRRPLLLHVYLDDPKQLWAKPDLRLKNRADEQLLVVLNDPRNAFATKFFELYLIRWDRARSLFGDLLEIPEKPATRFFVLDRDGTVVRTWKQAPGVETILQCLESVVRSHYDGDVEGTIARSAELHRRNVRASSAVMDLSERLRQTEHTRAQRAKLTAQLRDAKLEYADLQVQFDRLLTGALRPVEKR